MVLLTMTAVAVEALHQLPPTIAPEGVEPSSEAAQAISTDDEPSLTNPAVGDPISHGQIIDLWQQLQSTAGSAPSLETLLRGSRVYVPPPPPKPEKSKEYLALMARLRREEEARAYERMINPPPALSTFNHLAPHSSRSFTEANRPLTEADLGDTEVEYNDIHRQLMLILNFVLSIAGVAGTLWVLARWWSTPARIFLTMGGSIAVGIAEVVVYQAYVWKMGEAKKGQGKVKEVKEVVKTWVVEKGKTGDGDTDAILIKEGDEDLDGVVRRRHVPAKDEKL